MFEEVEVGILLGNILMFEEVKVLVPIGESVGKVKSYVWP